MIAIVWGVAALLSLPALQIVGGPPTTAAALRMQIARVQDSVLEARVRAVASELRCPVCQGESIQDSPAALAQEMKVIVREQLAAGRTPEEVKAYFVDKYGEWILLTPEARGWNLLVYVLPLVALLIGAAVITRATRRWTKTRDGNTQGDAERESSMTSM